MPADQIIENSHRAHWAIVALAVICLLWAGMVLGISCLETPIKFSAPALKQAVAPELGRALAFDIGRVVFDAFSKVQVVWSVLTFVLLLVVRPFQKTPRAIAVLFALVWPIVAFQTFVLVPALATRAQMVLSAPTQKLPPAPYHALYTSTELVKLIALITLGILLINAAPKAISKPL